MPLIAASRIRFCLRAALTLPLFGSLAWAQSVIATVPASDGTQGNPMSIAINPLTSRVYIAGSNVEVVDQNTNEVIDTIDVGSGQLQGIAVDPVLRRAYVIDYTQGVFALDLNSNSVIANYPYSNVNGIAVNPATHRVYVQTPDTNGTAAMLVFDGSTLNLIATIDDPEPNYTPFGDPQVAVFVNPSTDKVYAVVNRYPGALWVVDGQTNTSVTTIKGLAPLAYGGDVDTTRNLIFVAGWFGDISKIDGATNTLISTNSGLDGQPDGVSVDPANQKVYVAIQQMNEVRVVDEKTNTVTQVTIPVGTTPVNTALDYGHELLYVGDTRENVSSPPPPSVSVIKLN